MAIEKVDAEYRLLLTQKEPFLWLDRCKVYVKGGLVQYSKRQEDGTVIHIPIPAGSTLLLILGPGSSITHEAAVVCGDQRISIAMTKGEVFVHSVWNNHLYPDPQKLVRQASLHGNDESKLEYAKTFLRLKLLLEGKEDKVDSIAELDSIGKLLSYEAHEAKRTYADLARRREVAFKRDKSSQEDVNGRITLLNNALYSICTSVILAYGQHPSMGFIHGKTRRGGLSFDLADVFKFRLSLLPSFSFAGNDNRQLIKHLASQLKKDGGKVLKNMLTILAYVNDELTEEELLVKAIAESW